MIKIEVDPIYLTINPKKKPNDVIKQCQKQIQAKSSMLLRGSKFQEIGKVLF